MTECSTSTNNFLNMLTKQSLYGAPLAGVTTPSFRNIVRLFFDGLIYTEMISVEGLRRNGPATMIFLKTNENDSPLGVQLFGSKPDGYTESIPVVLGKLTPAVIDINMGCPVKKVLKSGSGCAMMKDEQNIARVINAAKRAAGDIPVTIKIRLGWDMDSMNYNEIIKIAHEEGASAVTLHGRTKADHFSGTVRYEYIADAVSRAKLPIIGNGDVIDMETYDNMLKTGVNGVMIGRGMMKKPWIFEALLNETDPDTYLQADRLKELVYKIMDLEMANARGSRYLDVSKKYIVWMMKGLPGAASLRSQIYACQDRAELDDMIEDFFNSIKDIQTDQSSE
ncbi:MAG: tRNA dihydrouridine synthase [Deferribacterales bacterium]